ncbi:MAG: hypothetical protein KGL38_04165 [Gemmatimonadota bacterium]|nr:hypothetical protein [Gemmatimonadota bacterium]MDE3127175.1 hypothetical protein [Gemmatimonadota bacterium]MDE3173305.1 hypothetical protein [Gemmatimonadota bacterium]MDE3216628.1 hypothetical protein [Gemmatimonadota bacterium]
MFTLRVVRHDRPEQLLAECLSAVVPSSGETLQLDPLDGDGEPSGPSTCWRVIAVTLHVPSVRSDAPRNGRRHEVRMVDVAVRPDVMGVPDLVKAAQEILSESRM